MEENATRFDLYSFAEFRFFSQYDIADKQQSFRAQDTQCKNNAECIINVECRMQNAE